MRISKSWNVWFLRQVRRFFRGRGVALEGITTEIFRFLLVFSIKNLILTKVLIYFYLNVNVLQEELLTCLWWCFLAFEWFCFFSELGERNDDYGSDFFWSFFFNSGFRFCFFWRNSGNAWWSFGSCCQWTQVYAFLDDEGGRSWFLKSLGLQSGRDYYEAV